MYSWRSEPQFALFQATPCPAFLGKSCFFHILAAAFLNILFDAVVFDDAYITFRVVDNFVHGYGLRWNVDERVQAYTHPFWMLLHIPLYAAFGSIYGVTITLSAVFGTLAVWWLARLAGPSLLSKSLWVILPLALSRTFRIYVVSGLENPLSFFLFAWILWELFGPRFNYYRFCFAVALCSITRLDNVVPLMPLVLALTWQERRELHWNKLLLALSPALLWYGFSLFYYGFFFPNTKYAKLHMGVPALSYARQGLVYFYNFTKCDPLAFLLSTAGICIALKRLPEALRNRFTLSKETLLVLLGLGMVCNVVYIILAGGDFMPGRFFANIFLISVGILAVVYAPVRGRRNKSSRSLCSSSRVTIISCCSPPSSTGAMNRSTAASTTSMIIIISAMVCARTASIF